MRTAFIQQLIKEAEHNDKIFLIVGDLGYHVVEPFMEKFPGRFLNAGIAEQNTIGMAAGLAKEGYNVYFYSIANFPTLRCLEQIRNDVTYYNSNVKIVSVGAGFAYGSLGVSHHATEEIGIMRSLPNMVVASPSDPSEAQAIAAFSAAYSGAMYIRLGKAGEKQIFPETGFHDTLRLGKPHCLREYNGKNVLIATGSILNEAVRQLAVLNVDTAIYSMPFIKPMDKEALGVLAQRHPNMVIIEEHQRSCGLGSAVVEQLSDLYAEGALSDFPKVHRVAIGDKYVHVAGTQDYLRQVAHLYLTGDLFV